MSQKDKLWIKFKEANTFSYKDLVTMLQGFGYIEKRRGKTGGSAVIFYNEETQGLIHLHSPHPQKEIKAGVIKSILLNLKEQGIK